MIGLRHVENLLTGQTSKLDESITRMRSLAASLEDVATGVLVISDGTEQVAQALVAAIIVETGTMEAIRQQLVLARYLLKVRGPEDRPPR